MDKESYLLELSRYVVLNPVRAGMVGAAATWPWSSYRATAGERTAPAFLTTDALLSTFGKRKQKARERYVRFVAEGALGRRAHGATCSNRSTWVTRRS